MQHVSVYAFRAHKVYFKMPVAFAYARTVAVVECSVMPVGRSPSLYGSVAEQQLFQISGQSASEE